MDMRMGRWIRLAAVMLAVFAAGAFAADEDYLKAKPADLQWWQDARFGLFVHWGPVSLKGTEISWSRGGNRKDYPDPSGKIPVEEYDNLYKQFNPTKFDARKWVEIAKSAGMKYLVFTTKHHDGFCEFDSKLTDYKITNSPFKRDIVAEIAKACHAGGLRLGFYYSPADWHHPDYRTANHPRYIEYLHGQLRELCTNYGKVDIIWFDSLSGDPKLWDSPTMFKFIRELQPHILINPRAGLPGDFDTPEQEVGKFQNTRPWESCITIGDQWAYRPNDNVKSMQQCVQTLVRCACGDGNLLFNVGPMPTGEIEPRQVERLKEMGQWLRKHGKTIYGTRGGPFILGSRGGSTYSGDTVYLHILDWPEDALSLPPIGAKIVSFRSLTGGKAEVKQTASGIEVSLPEKDRDPIDTIIALKLDGPASKIEPVRSSLSLTSGKKATASNVYQKSGDFGPSKAVDDDFTTRWATDSGVQAAWLEVDLGSATTFDRALISEAIDRVQEFELQCREGEEWKTFARGTTIGNKLNLKFEPVTARFVRLNILKATDGPTISELQLAKS